MQTFLWTCERGARWTGALGDQMCIEMLCDQKVVNTVILTLSTRTLVAAYIDEQSIKSPQVMVTDPQRKGLR